MTTEHNFTIRFAQRKDTYLILDFIKQLAGYEHLLDEVVATPAVLELWLFDKHKAEVIIGEEDGVPVGFALFFHNFSTFLGRAGIYLSVLKNGAADTAKHCSGNWRRLLSNADAAVLNGGAWTGILPVLNFIKVSAPSLWTNGQHTVSPDRV